MLSAHLLYLLISKGQFYEKSSCAEKGPQTRPSNEVKEFFYISIIDRIFDENVGLVFRSDIGFFSECPDLFKSDVGFFFRVTRLFKM